MTTLTRAVYGLFGTLSLLAGAVALVVPSLILPDAASSGLAAHLVREQAAGFVFIGLMFFWCLRHFAERRSIHLGLLLFTTLFAVIHWAEYLQSDRYLVGAAINTLPTLVLAATAPYSLARK